MGTHPTHTVVQASEAPFQDSDGATEQIALVPRSVADFYQAVMKALNKQRSRSGDLDDASRDVRSIPSELDYSLAERLRQRHTAYDRASVDRFWQILAQVNRIMSIFRSGFGGKSSPVQFFWGSFDLALTRFSGRVAPRHPEVPGMADWITQESYSHELSS